MVVQSGQRLEFRFQTNTVQHLLADLIRD
ncbi:unnamed protein product, partial [Mesorhabditis spiculigera]